MILKHSLIFACFYLLFVSPLQSQDWNQWRGKNRNGIIKKSPALLDSWDKSGPPLVWKSADKIPGGERGGYGSPVVWKGRVYLYASPKANAKNETGQDAIYCLDAKTGKTLWKKEFKGIWKSHGSASTPCVKMENVL